MADILPFESPSALDSENLQRTEAQFRGTRASSMVRTGTGATHMIVLTIHARGATTSPLPGCWCVHNTARRAAADHGASGAFPGVEEPESGSGRVPQGALK